MSLNKKQIQPNGPGGPITSLFLGPRAEEQKPKLCSRCGQPIAMAYRVYAREFNAKLGVNQVSKGQYEVAHIWDGKPVFDVCPFPSLLDRLNERINKEVEEKVAMGQIVRNSKQTVHIEEVDREKGGGAVRVMCGARGNLWTTLDSELATCYNCRVRLSHDGSNVNKARVQVQIDRKEKEIQDQIDGNNQQQSTTGEETMSATETVGKPKMTAQDIKAKIAASKAAKGAESQGTSANLGQAGEAPLPRQTGVKKQAIQTAKVDKGPKLLNACGCGCEQPTRTPGGNFIPGHDAKLHSMVKKLAAGTMSLADVPEQVRNGMYPKVKQPSVKDGEGKVTLAGVEPSVDEVTYLKTLKGLGGPVNA